MRPILIAIAACLFASAALTAQTKQAPLQTAERMGDRIIAATPYTFTNKQTGEVYTNVTKLPLDLNVRVTDKRNDWHYTNGVLALAMMELADASGDAKYEAYVLNNMNFVFNEGNLDFFRRQYDKVKADEGWKGVRNLSWHMIFRGKRLDDNGPMAASLIELQAKHPDDNFLAYINQTADHLNYAEPRLADGTIARIWPHENTVWADDSFMAVAFLARMGRMTGEDRYFTDAANQILNYSKYLWCPEKQIYYHCYHTDNQEHGVAHWSRANGWIFMATADLLTLMPANHPLRQQVIDNFRRQASGIARYQAPSGLWHQLLDKPDSYEEITGTAMFVFGMARGVRMGWLHPDFIYVAEQGLKGMNTLLSDGGDVSGICVGTGIMPSVAYYYNRPTQSNDPMGEGPVMRALVEMSKAPKYSEISADAQYDKIVVKK
jgi:rhamnogalacturonyl hydrolase YesR